MINITLDGYKIYDLFISGASNLMNYEEALNNLNVFPVPDSDTGTNLALTMKSIVLNSKKDKSVHNTLKSIANTATANAYGNSGMIFAQYFNGYSIETKGKDTITLEDFAITANKASLYAYESVQDPKEGTILTLMREWSLKLLENVNVSSIDTFFESSYEKANLVVEETKYKLKVLMDHNVVDAGAKGFLFFIQGIIDFLKTGKRPEFATLSNPILDSHTNDFSDISVSNNIFCTQFYINTKRSLKDLKKDLFSLGDSMVIVGQEPNFHIHIHTDSPDLIMSNLLADSDVLSQKIENMKWLNMITHKRKYKIAIITDSIADLPNDLIEKEQITVIPANVVCDNNVYLDKVTITNDNVFNIIDSAKKHPTSAQPTQSHIDETFKILAKNFDSIIGIFVSKEMSGTYAASLKTITSDDLKDKKISLINSNQNSGAEGLLVRHAAILLSENKSHEEIVNEIEALKANTHIYVAVDDLDSMIKGGRISKRAGYILSKINLKPVISIDLQGKGIVYKKTLSQKQAQKSILKKLKKDSKEQGILDYCIVYSELNAQVKVFYENVKEILKKEAAYLEPISNVVAVNAGKRAYAIAYTKKGGN